MVIWHKGGARMRNDELVRKNIRMSGNISDWYEDRAKYLGVSQTNLITMVLAEYIKQEKAVNMMSNFEYVMEQLEELKGNAPEK